MTYASHTQVITVIIQTNLIHLSIKMTMPHQWANGFFKIEGFAGKRSQTAQTEYKKNLSSFPFINIFLLADMLTGLPIDSFLLDYNIERISIELKFL